MAPASAWAGTLRAEPGDSPILFKGSTEFSEFPTRFERSASPDSRCAWGFWQGRSLQAEVVHCRTSGNTYYMDSYLRVRHLLPIWLTRIERNKLAVTWQERGVTLRGAMGPVEVHKFTLVDRVDYKCAGFLGAWGSIGSGRRNVITGYLCSPSAAFPLDEVIAQRLEELGLEGSFEHLIEPR